MKILIIDGQGGRIGGMLAEGLKAAAPGAEITAVGTNSSATAAMLRAGADHAATGENPGCVCARGADYILGPVGIAVADALLGEVTPRMAAAVCQSPAEKILIPVGKCGVIIAGTGELSVAACVEDAVRRVARGPKNEV